MWIRSLGMSECLRVLAENRLGHLACANDGMPYVVPIHYAYADDYIYGFSLPGKKIDILRANPQASLQVEKQGPGRQWQSAIVEGRFEELPDRIGHKRERDHAWTLLSRYSDWWQPGGVKPIPASSGDLGEVFFRIGIERVSGREAKEEMPPDKVLIAK